MFHTGGHLRACRWVTVLTVTLAVPILLIACSPAPKHSPASQDGSSFASGDATSPSHSSGRSPSPPLASLSRGSSIIEVHACALKDLRITVWHVEASGDYVNGYIRYTDIRGPACFLRGWPILAGRMRTGQIVDAKHTSGTPSEKVQKLIIGNHRTVVSDIAGRRRSGGGNCPAPFITFEVNLPGASGPGLPLSAYIRALHGYMPSCGGLAESPIVPVPVVD
jgi:hypothetical protein